MSDALCPTETTPTGAGASDRTTVLGLDIVGLVCALFFFAWSLSPSLLPRT